MSPVKHFQRAELTMLLAAALAVAAAALIVRALDELDAGKRAMRAELRDTRLELDDLQRRWAEEETAPAAAPKPDEPPAE